MRNLLIMTFAFFLLFSQTVAFGQSDRPKTKIKEHVDPVPQTSKPTPRDTMPEEKLWETAVNKFEHTQLDSSSGNTIRRIAKYEGVKFQLRKNTGNLQVVNSWEYRCTNTSHGIIVLYIFSLQNKEKIIVSLRQLADYKVINLFFEAHGESPMKIPAYVPNTINYKDLNKIILSF